MSDSLTVNKQGQEMGRKGLETRQRLLAATRRLLKKLSPLELTAVAIAKAANISSATFYLYFRDVKDILYALSEEAEQDMAVVHQILDEPWDPTHFEFEHAMRVVQAFASVWKKHRDVLRARNLEADRRDPRFEQIRLRTNVRIVERFGAHILAASRPDVPITRLEAMADGSVLMAAMERLAMADAVQVKQNVGEDAMWTAMARNIARTLMGHREAQDSILSAATKSHKNTRIRARI